MSIDFSEERRYVRPLRHETFEEYIFLLQDEPEAAKALAEEYGESQIIPYAERFSHGQLIIEDDE